jgi:glycine cleavage system pyridoxal-binding protein P
MVCDLTGMALSNASLLDEATGVGDFLPPPLPGSSRKMKKYTAAAATAAAMSTMSTTRIQRSANFPFCFVIRSKT